ncbi:hypothetical protein C4K04_1454 [Pseudomonas chlororaphis]|uniref:Uncharacterized protein n=1 Tax=Pseudomonas chlororaphis TaxID=587753 RepID=A0A3G7TJ90_9PSED|nr:hypothetical protein C4K04_1454 [Pseudomonas chlororaphis]
MQPSEIARLDMVAYWRWVESCEREISRRVEAAERMSR